MSNRTGLVLAGAAARGAYEAGALSVLLPVLEQRKQRPTVLVGTSAGALNATFLASRADEPAVVATRELLDLWLSIGRRQVFNYAPLSVAASVGQELGLPFKPRGVVDTSPLRATLNAAIGDWGRIRRNVEHGDLDALAVVTTSAVSGRTVVFVEGGRAGRGRRLPEQDLKKGIHYVRPVDGITADHVLASASIPILFPPVEIATGDGTSDWFVDGGLRLNTPIKPALKLDARRVVIVAADPAVHSVPEPSERGATPDFDDLVLHFLQAALADPLIEDMWRLAGVNTLLGSGAGTADKRPIEYLFVGPDRRGDLGARAGQVVKRLGLNEFRLFDWILGRQGGQHQELLSYLLFHPEFFEAAADLGMADARAELDRLADAGIDWRTEPMTL